MRGRMELKLEFRTIYFDNYQLSQKFKLIFFNR